MSLQWHLKSNSIHLNLRIMAAQTSNGITLNYPNDPCTVFNPCVFRLTGTTLARSRVTITSGGKTYTATYQTPKGGELDLRQFLQVLFDGLTLGADLEQITDSQVSELGKSVTITIEALDNDDNVLGTKVVNNVPFKRNRQTILRGNVFTAEPTTSSFKIETAWLSDYTMDF